VSRLAGVTVRTLHHYDEIGLLCPGERSAAGYRRYRECDLERLQQVRYYRELGFPLDEIATIIDDLGADAMSHLRRQHALLMTRIDHLRAMVVAVEYAMEAVDMGIALTPQERFEVFGDNDPEQYADEVRERWGDTDAYRQSQRRASRYTKADWAQIKTESEEIGAGLAEALRSGQPAEGEVAMGLVERHRQHIGHWFYDCSYEIHRGLGEMYLADPRFTATYDTIEPGLAQYVHDAIEANAARATSG
jgi:DNA-binding transcriptional MerR regulator